LFQVLFTNSANRTSRKLPKKVREKAVFICDNILAKNPFVGKALHTPFRGYFSYRFKVDNIGYRLVYLIKKEAQVIQIVLLGSRENFYKRLQRSLKN